MAEPACERRAAPARLPYWSLSAWAKANVKNAVSFIGRFEDALVAEGRRRGVDGVVCGHIHTAAIRDLGGFSYVNTGDWVESCTAILEHQDGRMELVEWHRAGQATAPLPMPAAPQRRAA